MGKNRLQARAGSGAGPHHLLLLARPSRGASRKQGEKGSQPGCAAAHGHLCLPVLWGRMEEFVDPQAGKASLPPQGMAGETPSLLESAHLASLTHPHPPGHTNRAI